MSSIKKIGIIGAGQMGGGIAQVCAQAGIDVILHDLDEDILAKCVAGIEKNLDRQVQKAKLTEAEKADAMSHISTGLDMSVFADADLVVEAATENEALKREILKRLVPNLKPEAIIATNTSSISITRLAASTDRPAKFIGMHFMNPVPAMTLVELIRGIATDEPTFSTIRELTGKIGKTAAVAEDFPAFIVNRILLPMINEAVYTLYEGVGGVEAIDTAMKLGANHPMGPLELADFIGLDTCLAVMQVLYEGLADEHHSVRLKPPVGIYTHNWQWAIE